MYRLILILLLSPALIVAQQQTVVDKMVTAVNGTELITYSDLLWQLALQPGTQLDNPRSEDLQHALQLMIDQVLIAEEAEKLPTIAPKEEEIKAELADLISRFPSRAEFEQRLSRVGLTTDRLNAIIRRRVAIEKYLDFRFRSFTVVTPSEVEEYYKSSYVPRMRRQSPGTIVPGLEEAREEIEKILTENKIESDTDAFLDAARQRAEIVTLSPI
jgi:hypothetical protein